jgi:dihydroorotase
MSTMLIRGGRIVDPAQKLDAISDVLLHDGRVAQVGPKIAKPGDAEVIDAKGVIVAPGFIDVHVHLREPGQQHKETIATGTAAAAAGGFASVCAMPNTAPVNDSAKITRWMQEPQRGAVVNVFPIPAATVGSLGEKLTDFRALRDAGAVAFSDDGKPIVTDEMMRRALLAADEVGAPVVQHSEVPSLSYGCTMHAGPTAFRLGLHGMPAEAEALMVERDIRLVRETGGHLHVAHVSTRRSVEAIRKAKAEGLHVSCEITPHHFTLIDEHVGRYDTHYKMCPPLRSEDDRQAMIEALVDGTIDCIATDHAPHAAHEKQQEFERAPNGITGLETALPLVLQGLHRYAGLPLARIVELLSTNPALIFGLANRGTLKVGASADLTIFDPDQKWTFYAADSRSKSRNTPFDGWQFRGKVRATIVGGRIVFQG